MQESDYRNLKGELTEKIVKEFSEQQSGIGERSAAIRMLAEQTIDKFRDENKLFSLSEDEVQLLLDYRKWKLSPRVISGIFHWKKV